MEIPNETHLEWLASEGFETLCFKPGQVCAYDVAAFRRIPRNQGRPVEAETPPVAGGVRPVSEPRLDKRPYLVRLGGFRRGNAMGPDAAGHSARQAGILYADGLGNGLFESIGIARKYGIWPSFEAPATGFPIPFCRQGFSTFRERYRKECRTHACFIRQAEGIFGQPLLKRKESLWPLWIPHSPLSLLAESLSDLPEETSREIEEGIGAPWPLRPPVSASERAALARFWKFIRGRHADLLRVMSDIFREEVAGDGMIVGNMHLLPPTDYMRLGEVFDLPGVAVRPGYFEDPFLQTTYTVFAVKLFAELSGKPPLVSVRTNLLSAGSRTLPRERQIEAWHAAALQGGSAGFYLWPRDYPVTGEPAYDGPMMGNPLPWAGGAERWQANLAVLGRLATLPKFVPPPAAVGLLVPVHALDSAGWRRVFNTYLACARIGLHVRLLDVSHLAASDVRRAIRGLLIPALEFVERETVERLNAFVASGGAVVANADASGAFDLQGAPHARSNVPFGNAHTGAAPESRTDGRGTVRWVSGDTLGGGAQNDGVDWRAIDRGASEIRAWCQRHHLPRHSWIGSLELSDLENAAKTSAVPTPFSRPEPDPAVRFRHYQYEHSSDWIMTHEHFSRDETHD